MRYRLNKKQMEMLANGKQLVNGKDKIIAPKDLQESLKTLLEQNVLEYANVFIEITETFPKTYSFKMEKKEN